MSKIAMSVAVLVSMMLTSGLASGEEGENPRVVAAAYLTALEASDLDRAGALFAQDSSVYETGGVEGTWQHYREHHLAPEIGAIDSFSIARQDPEIGQSEDGSMAFIAWPIEYTIELRSARTIHSKGTVTFVLVREKGEYRIRHIHWSSRPFPAKAEGEH